MNVAKTGTLIVGLQWLLATAPAAPVILSLNADRHVADGRFAIAAKAEVKEVKKEPAGKPDLVPNEFTISKLTTANK